MRRTTIRFRQRTVEPAEPSAFRGCGGRSYMAHLSAADRGTLLEYDERVVLAWVATELLDMQEAADGAGEQFLAYLIDMARLEAERLCAQGVPPWPPREPGRPPVGPDETC